MVEPGQLKPRHIKKNKKMYWDKISSRSNYDKKMFEESFRKVF